MKKAILILLTVLLAVSCSQVVYDNLPPVEIGGKYDTTLIATQDGTSTALKLRFNAVPYIAQYGYDVNGSDIEAIPDSEIKIVNGNYEFTIAAETIGNQYNGEIYLYGKVSSDGGTEEWVNIGYTEYSIAIEGTAPAVNLYARNETEAVLYIDSPPAGMIYKVDVKEDSNGDPIEGLSESDLLPENDGMLHISNLENDKSYVFDVYQKKAGDKNDYPTVYSSVEVGPFTNEVKLVLTEDKNTGFVVEIAEDLTEITTVTLVNDTTDKELATVNVIGNSATFAYDLIPSLEAGLFYAKATSAGEEYISNYVDTITPITVLEMSPNYKSVSLKVKFSDQITDPSTAITLSTPGTPSTFEYIEQEDGTYLLVINGLNSNTSYPNLNLRATVNEVRNTVIIDAFKTQSFAGKIFEWEGKFTNGKSTKFIIYVDNAPEGSDYPYYVYFSKNDPYFESNSQNYEKSEFRVMPLVDNSIRLSDPEPETSETMQVDCETGKAGDNYLTLQNEAYKINSKKWNTISATLISWYIVNGDGYPFDKDIVMTTTKTKAEMFFTINSETCTSFYFMEKDLNGDNIPEPFIKFVNAAGSDGYANVGLAKNSASESEWKKFESEKPEDSEHTFYLSPVFLLEGGV